MRIAQSPEFFGSAKLVNPDTGELEGGVASEGVEIAFIIITGGVGTTTALTSNALRHLGLFPEKLRRLMDEPSLIPIYARGVRAVLTPRRYKRLQETPSARSTSMAGAACPRTECWCYMRRRIEMRRFFWGHEQLKID